MDGFIENEQFRILLRDFPKKAVEQLYKYSFQSLLAFSTSLTDDRKASEDIVQDAFVNVWENHVSLSKHHDTSLQFYLVRIVKNRSINFYKRARRDRAINHALRQLQTPGDMLDHLIEGETQQIVRALIETFPLRERQCLLFRLDDQLSNEQIASTLNISVKAVEKSITSARKRLKAQVGSNR